MLDVLIEPEAAGIDRDIAPVVPVEHVDVVIGQHRGHGDVDQRREVPRQPWDQHHRRLLDLGLLDEVQQRPERRRLGALLANRHLLVCDHHRVDLEVGTLVRDPERMHQFGGCSRRAEAERRLER